MLAWQSAFRLAAARQETCHRCSPCKHSSYSLVSLTTRLPERDPDEQRTPDYFRYHPARWRAEPRRHHGPGREAAYRQGPGTDEGGCDRSRLRHRQPGGLSVGEGHCRHRARIHHLLPGPCQGVGYRPGGRSPGRGRIRAHSYLPGDQPDPYAAQAALGAGSGGRACGGGGKTCPQSYGGCGVFL